ncbi:hypothetical protein ABIB06_002568 [Bradyrhizobium sp. LB8.2]|uniref:hypothetical protein n=1 Tax=unclassified Bradyrhizobium TaxID=2631580 RepID=UPI0033995BFE
MTKRKKSGPPSFPRKQSGKVNTPKATVTIESFLEELNNSGRKLRKSNKGHQALLREPITMVSSSFACKRSIAWLVSDKRLPGISGGQSDMRNSGMSCQPSAPCVHNYGVKSGKAATKKRADGKPVGKPIQPGASGNKGGRPSDYKT